ncbi:hypothetical protein CFC21_069869 [Triticum aestivum]|uniref:KIB1-4 beta-propeller domain-containing protein n=2 Tax=Triticum aestivum TaxID=4565 RepID=A0A9R1HDB6_WHEAT|nr:hypothetical protein CFC21_069869 [Triticum aestivum]
MELPAPMPVTLPLPLPCLVVDHDGAGGEPCTTLLDVSKGEHQHQYHACDGDAHALLRNRRRWMTPHGWVLSCDPSTLATFLWSPQTTEKIDLPPLTPGQEIPLHSSCSLSGKPTAAGFTVVAVEPEKTAVWYCHVGGNASDRPGWVRYEYDVGSVTFPVVNDRRIQGKKFITRLTAVGGKFYFFKSHDELGVLEFSPAPLHSSVPVRAVERPPGTTCMAPSFVELGGELYLASAFLHYDSGGATSVLGCGVYKLDLAGKRWCKVSDIGDRAFLMCPLYFSGCCSATASGLRPNCVYWMGLCDDDLLRVFDIDRNEGTHGVHDPCKDISGANRNAVWMLPSDEP